MTEQAPQAQAQYDSQRWHIEFRMHIDLADPNETYVVAEISKRVPLEYGHSWVQQDKYDWLKQYTEPPTAGQCWHNYMLNQLETIRRWLMDDHTAAAREQRDTQVREAIGVSYTDIPPPQL